jgi:rfaE bifunctional protein nucleotidyltransferase chain/domain
MTKIIDRREVSTVAAQLKAAGQTVVFTNGCFDILHAGHVRYLAAARELGNRLIVGLNSDQSVRRLKGPERPINPAEDRAEVMAALAAVDYVVIFDDPTAEGLVDEIKPDIYVKGGDYHTKDLPEATVAAKYGGRTVLIPEVPGRSSSRIIGKIKETAPFDSK